MTIADQSLIALAEEYAEKLVDLEVAKGEIKRMKEELERLKGAMSTENIEKLFSLQAKQGEVAPPSHDKRRKAPIFSSCYVETEQGGSQRLIRGPIICAEFYSGKLRSRASYRITFTPFVQE